MLQVGNILTNEIRHRNIIVIRKGSHIHSHTCSNGKNGFYMYQLQQIKVYYVNCWLDIYPLYDISFIIKIAELEIKEFLHLLHKKLQLKLIKYITAFHISVIHMQKKLSVVKAKRLETFFTFIKIDRKDVFLKDDVLQHYCDIIIYITAFVMRNFRYYSVQRLTTFIPLFNITWYESFH